MIKFVSLLLLDYHLTQHVYIIILFSMEQIIN